MDEMFDAVSQASCESTQDKKTYKNKLVALEKERLELDMEGGGKLIFLSRRGLEQAENLFIKERQCRSEAQFLGFVFSLLNEGNRIYEDRVEVLMKRAAGTQVGAN